MSPVRISEEKCRFNPRLVMVPVGSRIEIVNMDRKDHWFVIEGEHKKREQYVQQYTDLPPVFTLKTPGVHHLPADSPVEFMTTEPDIWHIKSGFHRWMEGWVVVTDRIWFDQVDESGRFVITDVPRGVYNLHAWHPILGDNVKTIRVPDDTRGRVDISYSELPEHLREITSTVISTWGEVEEEEKDRYNNSDDDW